MLFETELFDTPLFEADGPVTVPPAPIFRVTREDAGTPYTFTAPIKDPNSIERHGMDWSAWLQDGDAIDTVDVFADRAGLTIDQENHGAGIVSWRISGGTLGADYIVTCRVITTSGLVDDRSVRYRVRER
jgi:hypothetical protein